VNNFLARWIPTSACAQPPLGYTTGDGRARMKEKERSGYNFFYSFVGNHQGHRLLVYEQLLERATRNVMINVGFVRVCSVLRISCSLPTSQPN
jgi:hypothetical protein